ncbi:MAG: hypothetical protein KDC90_08155 [Ignavibacteriae bacterium]|nr:hypothetical protein [Ignavibacteriota bacterium]
MHDDSIQGIIKQNRPIYLRNKFNVYWKTYIKYRTNLEADERVFLLTKACLFYLRLMATRHKEANLSHLFKALELEIGLPKAVSYVILCKLAFLLKRGEVVGVRIFNFFFD